MLAQYAVCYKWRLPASRIYLWGKTKRLLKFCLYSEIYFDVEINDLYIVFGIPSQQFYQLYNAHIPFF